ncbi:type I restriction-modification system subunit M N-terminal domain-containing protein [Nitrosomonas sp. Nm58]|uniref:type I restriction-modification system subunit M N-terminal domain-containing protein n=1 Tax=Nitrosomonas sp. Nm58 TaxID=200126 RepID=UPI001C433493|nr:type I restriction-modification system subunit M N-terminal domain-containing protein [Nitrosomonas sp. Nm58]
MYIAVQFDGFQQWEPITKNTPYSCFKKKSRFPNSKNFLFKAADILRGKMDASKFKEFIFGMLFLKRLSDEFDRKRAHLRKTTLAHLKDQPALLDELLNDKTSYGDTFYVSPRARWHESWVDQEDNEVPPLKHLKYDIGNILKHESPRVYRRLYFLRG